MANKKNILMISVDQLSAKRIGAYGDMLALTPTIDFLANNGLKFENCYSPCPICIPARRTLMTSLSPKTHGDRVYNDTLKMPDVPTLAGEFRKAGYQTFAVGKLHVYPQRNRIGFDDAIIMEEGRNEFGVYDDYQIWLGEHGLIADEFMHTIGNNQYYTRPWHLPEYAHPTTWLSREMAKIIRRRDSERPSFFYISFPGPHPPLTPLQQYLDMFDLNEISEEVYEDDWGNVLSPAIDSFRNVASGYSQKQKKMAIRAYYATCAHIDSQIRLLLGTLRESNILDNTIIVFISDHGDMLFEHNMAGKRCFYDGSARVPFIISGLPIQNLIGNVDTGKVVSLIDVMPTLLDLCEVDIPISLEGINVCSNQKHDYIFGEITEGDRATRMIVDEKYKLIYYPANNIVQLFDMANDKTEQRNLANNSDYCEIVLKMEKLLVQNLHDGDEMWVKDGKLVGFAATEKKHEPDFGLHNQRGLHWPPVEKYHNYGNN